MPVFSSVSEVIGRTPLLHLRALSKKTGVELYAKLEGTNPAGSVKDRIARAMVDDAEASGRLRPGATLIEPSSGNTGIALAMIAAARGYRLIVTLPQSVSEDRVRQLTAYGAEVVRTPGALMQQAVEQAELLGQTTEGAVLLRQFENPANPRAHAETTAEELWSDLDGAIDLFVAGVGTGGTITGVGRVLKQRRPSARVIAVEPEGAAVLSGKTPVGHGISGIGAGFVPKVLDRSVIDEVAVVSESEALDALTALARADGVLAGLSSGAALAAALRLAARRENAGKRCVVVLPDRGESYLTSPLFRALG